jgi:uncharacterized spore protein YtfJ
MYAVCAVCRVSGVESTVNGGTREDGRTRESGGLGGGAGAGGLLGQLALLALLGLLAPLLGAQAHRLLDLGELLLPLLRPILRLPRKQKKKYKVK